MMSELEQAKELLLRNGYVVAKPHFCINAYGGHTAALAGDLFAGAWSAAFATAVLQALLDHLDGTLPNSLTPRQRLALRNEATSVAGQRYAYMIRPEDC